MSPGLVYAAWSALAVVVAWKAGRIWERARCSVFAERLAEVWQRRRPDEAAGMRRIADALRGTP